MTELTDRRNGSSRKRIGNNRIMDFVFVHQSCTFECNQQGEYLSIRSVLYQGVKKRKEIKICNFLFCENLSMIS